MFIGLELNPSVEIAIDVMFAQLFNLLFCWWWRLERLNVWRSLYSQTQSKWGRKENNKRWLNYWLGHDRTTAPLGTLHQYFPYNLTQCCQDVPIHKQSLNDVLHSVIHTCTYSQSIPHTAMHYWRLGVILFLPAKDAYIFCHHSFQFAIVKSLLPLSQCKCCRAWLNDWCYLDLDETKVSVLSKAQAGLIPRSLLASKGERDKAVLSGPRRLSVSLPARTHVFPPLAALPAEPE